MKTVGWESKGRFLHVILEIIKIKKKGILDLLPGGSPSCLGLEKKNLK